MKNNVIITIIWKLSVITVSLSMIWFLMGSTACFQRNFDLVSTVIFLMVWLPAFSFVILSVFALKKGWLPNNAVAKMWLVVVIMAFSLAFIITLVRYTSPYGWLKESVSKDYLQTTSDGKYEYRLELVNMFQRNSYARIYIKNIANGEETKIPLDIPTEEKHVVIGGEDHTINLQPDNLLVWAKMMPTDKAEVYILTTTEIFDRDDTYCFTIDLNKTQVGERQGREPNDSGDG